MSESPENQVNPEAPATGASVSVPEVHVTPGGKSRPSIAGARRVRPEVSPSRVPNPAATQRVQAGMPANQRVEGEDQVNEPQEFEWDPNGPSPFDTAQDVRARAAARPRRKLPRVVSGILFGLCVVFLIACIMAMMRWVLPQDAADFKGTWSMDGAKNAVVISDSQIDLAGQASYDYTLDTYAKTIKVEFFTKDGGAHYRFSTDRRSIALIEGGNRTWADTLLSDLAWEWSDFIAMVQDLPRDPLGSEPGIILNKQ